MSEWLLDTAFVIALVNSQDFYHSQVIIITFSERLLEESWELYKQRIDKSWSWVDCLSFIVMKDRGLRDALTSDKHFEQAGFVALLRVK